MSDMIFIFLEYLVQIQGKSVNGPKRNSIRKKLSASFLLKNVYDLSIFATGKILGSFFPLRFFNFSNMRRTGSDVNMAKGKMKFRAAAALLMFSTFSAMKLSKSRTWHMGYIT